MRYFDHIFKGASYLLIRLKIKKKHLEFICPSTPTYLKQLNIGSEKNNGGIKIQFRERVRVRVRVRV